MRGFTLVELAVVAGIIGVLIVVVIANQSTFRSTVLLKNTASDIALSLRNAQIFGVGSRSTTNFAVNAPYGAEFSTSNSSRYTFFADTYPAVSAGATPNVRPGDGYYTPGSDSSVQVYTLNNGMTVSKFCATDTTPTTYCSTSASPLTHLSITFARPNPDAKFTPRNAGGVVAGTFTNACVTVGDTSGATRSIKVNLVGQITFTASCP